MNNKNEFYQSTFSRMFFGYARSGTLGQKKIFSFFYKISSPIAYVRSKLSAYKLSKFKGNIKIHEDIGFNLINEMDLPLLKEAVSDANNIFKTFESLSLFE